MFVQQAIIRWLEWGNYVLKGVVFILAFVMLVMSIFASHLNEQHKYEQENIVSYILQAITLVESILLVVVNYRNSNILIIPIIIFLIVTIVVLQHLRNSLKREFFQKLLLSCLEETKGVNSDATFVFFITKEQIMIDTGSLAIPTIRKPNSLSIRRAQAIKWINKMEHAKIINSFGESFEVSITEN